MAEDLTKPKAINSTVRREIRHGFLDCLETIKGFSVKRYTFKRETLFNFCTFNLNAFLGTEHTLDNKSLEDTLKSCDKLIDKGDSVFFICSHFICLPKPANLCIVVCFNLEFVVLYFLLHKYCFS